MPTTPTHERPDKSIRSPSLKYSSTGGDCSSAMPAVPLEMPSLNQEKRTEAVQYRPILSVSSRTPLAKTLANRKLRKYASETNFSLEESSASKLLEKEESQRTAIGGKKVFAIKSIPGDIVLRDGSAVCSRHVKHDDSEGEASYSGSDATLASISMTPILRQNLRRLRLNRPKSSTIMYETSISSDVYNTQTSATLPSIDSLQQIALDMTGGTEERRNSIFYNIDDDSLHEFDDEKGNSFHKSFEGF